VHNPTAGEECDDGNMDESDGCTSSCLNSSCGDGIIDPSEDCDDGDTDSGDGCSATCQEETGWTCVGEASVCTYLANNGDGCTALSSLSCGGGPNTDHRNSECFTISGTGPFSLDEITYEIGLAESQATSLTLEVYAWSGTNKDSMTGSSLGSQVLPAPAVGGPFTETISPPISVGNYFCLSFESNGKFSLARDVSAPFNFAPSGTGDSLHDCADGATGSGGFQSLDTINSGQFRSHWCAQATLSPQ
jgi:cysteine-rich repeat protein